MSDPHPTKRCPKCETVKPLDEFGVNRNAPDGLTSNCRQCVRSYQKARRLIHPPVGRGTSAGLKALARKAVAAERLVTEARAAKRRVAAEHKALATEVLAPALAALKAAVTALETLIGSPPVSTTKPRPANGTHPTKAAPSASPPSIREIRTIMTEQGIGRVEAKRIQEAEIIARAEWRPAITTH